MTKLDNFNCHAVFYKSVPVTLPLVIAFSLIPHLAAQQSRVKLIETLQDDLSTAIAHTTNLAPKDRSKLEHSTQVLIAAASMQRERHRVDTGKVKGALKDIEKVEKTNVFSVKDRMLLDDDRAALKKNLDQAGNRRARPMYGPRRLPRRF